MMNTIGVNEYFDDFRQRHTYVANITFLVEPHKLLIQSQLGSICPSLED